MLSVTEQLTQQPSFILDGLQRFRDGDINN